MATRDIQSDTSRSRFAAAVLSVRRSELIVEIDVSIDLLNRLHDNGALTQRHVTDIQSKATQRERVESLLRILEEAGDTSFAKFCDALNATDQRGVVAMLEEPPQKDTRPAPQALQGRKLKTLNILLLGETGVGKSTWINAFANYCHFLTLDEATQKGGIFPIPEVRGSLPPTIHPQDYTFICGDFSINFIDTPGPTHTTNVQHREKVRQNIDNIFKLLSKYDEFHAICIFISATQTRLTTPFRYCLTEVFRRLHRSACDNVIFIFTNAASVSYKPTQAQGILKQFTDEYKVQTLLSPDKRSYCFENDTVRTIREQQKTSNLRSEHSQNFSEPNWEQSVNAIKKMFAYIKSLKPHNVGDTKRLNVASARMSSIVKLLPEVARTIAETRSSLEGKQLQIQKTKQEIEEIERNPCKTVVCRAENCKLSPNKPHVCCKQCTSRLLYSCSKMDMLSRCKVCGCKASHHCFDTNATDVTNLNELSQELRKAADETQKRLDQIIKELDTILEANAKLRTYLERNCILREPGEWEEMEAVIEKETLSGLQKSKDRYRKHLENARKKELISSNIDTLVAELYRLPAIAQELAKDVSVAEIAHKKLAENTEKDKTHTLSDPGRVLHGLHVSF